MPKSPPLDSNEAFAERLSRECGNLGVSRRDLAELTARGQRAVNDWFEGRTAPTEATLEKIAELLGVRVEYLTKGQLPRESANRSELIVRDGKCLYAIAVRPLEPDPDGKLRDRFIGRYFAELIDAGEAYLDPFGREEDPAESDG